MKFSAIPLIFFMNSMCCYNLINAQTVNPKTKEPVDYVNPYIGHNEVLQQSAYTTVHLPNSFLRVNPERIEYSDVTLKGLPLISSLPVSPVIKYRDIILEGVLHKRMEKSCSSFSLSPFQGNEEDLQPIIQYSYDNEEITPYSYSVILDDKQDIDVRLGVSHQSAIYQIKFNGYGEPFLVLNASDGQLRWDGEKIYGYQILDNGVYAYLYLVPDKIPENNYVLEDDGLSNKSMAEGKNACIVLKYALKVNEINMRYGISFIDEEQARNNMEREVASKSIDEIQLEGRNKWNDVLGKIRVKGGSEDEKMVFYTALYRTYHRPVCISEDGRYFSATDGKIHDDPEPLYTDDTACETFRTLHPLNVLIEPEKELNILNSYLRMADQIKEFRMPKKIDFTGNSPDIHSNHIIISFIDAYNKGIKGFSLQKAFEAGKVSVTQRSIIPGTDMPTCTLDRFYEEHGYVPALRETEKETIPQVTQELKRMAVSVTLGSAYDNWALAQIAQALNKKEVFRDFYKRSINYQNVFNPSSGFFHPRGFNGDFLLPFDYELSGGHGGNLYYTGGNGWSFRFGLQYNITDLIGMMGGRDSFSTRLDSLFSKPLGLSKFFHYAQFPTQTGIVGGFIMGNKPSFHIPYLYNYIGQPWKTQERIRYLMMTWFRNDLMGTPGDDGGGTMSAFVVFSFMGFYPVTPGMPVYNIGSPMFGHTTIHLPNGRIFEIIAEKNSPQNKYIQSATLNGKKHEKPWFWHTDITNGGKLVLQMGPRPNLEWGSNATSLPPSSPVY